MSTNTLAGALAAARKQTGSTERARPVQSKPTSPPRAAPARNDNEPPICYAEALQIAIQRSIRSPEDVAARRMLVPMPGVTNRVVAR